MKKPIKTQAIKDRLNAYLELRKEIDNQRKRLDLMENMYASLSVPDPELAGMPRAKGGVSNPTAVAVERKIELEEQICEVEAKEKAERAAIEAMLEQIYNSDERAVIRLRYFDRQEWPDVCFVMYGDEIDFIDRQESYQNRTYKAHGRALLKLADILTASCAGVEARYGS